jgi:nicotinamidase/pyrazinamidase
VVLTQDWHPPGHASFASSHAGKQPFETTEMAYGTQVLWPDHCVRGTHDAALHAGLVVPHAQLLIRKGYHAGVDSYSAFQEADRKTPTGLAGYLRERGIEQVYVCGLATDFCVAWTALDARALGFATWVVEDATRAIDLNGSLAAAWQAMESQGVGRIDSKSMVE